MSLEKIANRIQSAKQVLILAHMRPDGDAIGSALALSKALDYLKTPYQVCIETDIPSNLTFVEGVEKIKKQGHSNHHELGGCYCVCFDSCVLRVHFPWSKLPNSIFEP